VVEIFAFLELENAYPKSLSEGNVEFNPNVRSSVRAAPNTLNPGNPNQKDIAVTTRKKNRRETGAVVNFKVIPRSSRNEIAGKEGEAYRVRITAPPVEGLANKALVELLSKKLGVSKGRIEIVSGHRSRRKAVLVHGLSEKEVRALLEA